MIENYTENYMVCNCKQVSYNDIISVVHNLGKIEDVVAAFDDVQKFTHCSTGCGGCHKKVLQIISDTMYGYESKPTSECEK